jgi:hypothetical protein
VVHQCRSKPLNSRSSSASMERSEAIRGNQRQSEAIRGNQRQSEAIRGNQRQSEAIRGNQRQSEAISGNPWSTSSASMEHSRAIKLGALSINRGPVPLPSAVL